MPVKIHTHFSLKEGNIYINQEENYLNKNGCPTAVRRRD